MPLTEDGRVYRVNGKDIVLYPISRLVSELQRVGVPRDAQTIRKWESSGVTPESTFRNGTSPRAKRLYTMEQIEAYCRIAQECNIKQGLSITSSDFSEKMWEALTEINKQYQEE